MKNRKLALLLIVSLLLVSLQGIGALAAEEERPVLTIARQMDTNIEDIENNAFTKQLEDALGIDLEFVLYPVAEYETKFSVTAASGSKLPDIINFSFADANTVYAYGAKGIFIPINEYLDSPEVTPHFNAMPQADQDAIRAGTTMADGNIYSFVSYTPSNVWNEFQQRAWINKTWLETLGLDEPTTTEEFRAVLEAFVSQDPNGNGSNDEYGMMGSTGGYGRSVIAFLMNAFIETHPSTNYFYVNDGKITPAFAQDAWLEGLTYMNGLVKDGLLSPLSFTQDDTQLKAIASMDDNVLGVVMAGSVSTWANNETETAPNFLDMKLLAPLTGPEGESNAAYNASTPSMNWFITSYCENPELAAKVGDYFYSREATMGQRYGVNGVNWSDDLADFDGFVAEYQFVGFDVSFAQFDVPWGTVQNVHWNGSAPAYYTEDIVYGNGIHTTRDEGKLSKNEYHYELYNDKKPAEYIGVLSYTADEIDELAMIKTAVDEYVKEYTVGFITGNISLNEWNA